MNVVESLQDLIGVSDAVDPELYYIFAFLIILVILRITLSLIKTLFNVK